MVFAVTCRLRLADCSEAIVALCRAFHQKYILIHPAQNQHRGRASISKVSMGLSYELQVFIIILGASVCVVLGFAVWRLRFHDPQHDANEAFDMSDEQKEYLHSVRDRNRRALIMESGVRL